MYQNLSEAHRLSNGQCFVDSVFLRASYPFLKKSRNYHENILLAAQELELELKATSAIQSAGWGVRALQGLIPRLKHRMVYEERGESHLIFLCTILIFKNIRSSLI